MLGGHCNWARGETCLSSYIHIPWDFSVSSVQLLIVSNSLRSRGLQHVRIPCLSPTPRVCSNSCPSSWWCHPTISSSVFPFSSCPQSFPASGSFLMSQFSQYKKRFPIYSSDYLHTRENRKHYGKNAFSHIISHVTSLM